MDNFFRRRDDRAGSTAESLADLDVDSLNDDLVTLTQLFPDVQPEAFREMLLHVSRKSRRELITERLLLDKDKWARGRYRPPSQSLDPADRFRTETYRRTVRDLLAKEFGRLCRSSIDAVLAEHNHCYSQARPVLQGLQNKSWRSFFTSLWTRRKTKEHPLIDWQPSMFDSSVFAPRLLSTSSLELNAELHRTLIAPVVKRQHADMLSRDTALAHSLNEQEAESADAMYDCECCYTPTTFEQLVVCDGDGGHYLCFRCVRHAAREALFGQGWAANIDTKRVSVRCIAPSTSECRSSISSEATRRALVTDTENDGYRVWQKLQDRIVADELLKSGLPLLRCPFCPYAELDDALEQSRPKTCFAFARTLASSSPAVLIGLVFLLAVVLYFPLCGILQLSKHNLPVQRIMRRKRGLRFTCASPRCGLSCCTLCASAWTDPHTCHSTRLTSLRRTIEAATTRAVKRTCPNCSTSFVKASGCNKFACACGYVMCYVCRRQIPKEGYAHFCTHFRPEARRMCAECERCDLYAVEDESVAVGRAADEAEKKWIEENGSVDVEGVALSVLGRRETKSTLVRERLEGVLDALLA